MAVCITVDPGEPIHVDRSGNRPSMDSPREGFVLGLGGAEVRFEDELDAQNMAIRILNRLGFDVAALKG